MEKYKHRSIEPGVKEIIADCITNFRPILCLVGVFALAFTASAKYYEITSSRAVSDWAARMTTKLHDPLHQLTPEETFYPRVRVVPAGMTLAEQLEMRIPVNVRDYPGTALRNGIDTLVVGTIPLGSIVHNVVMTEGDKPNYVLGGRLWGAFDCSDAPDMKLKPGASLKAGTICTVYGDYLMRADGSINYGKRIIGPSTADQQTVNR